MTMWLLILYVCTGSVSQMGAACRWEPDVLGAWRDRDACTLNGSMQVGKVQLTDVTGVTQKVLLWRCDPLMVRR